MAPMVPFCNDSNNVPLFPYVAEYYRQRVSSIPGGLLTTEATAIAPQAGGSANVEAYGVMTVRLEGGHLSSPPPDAPCLTSSLSL